MMNRFDKYKASVRRPVSAMLCASLVLMISFALADKYTIAWLSDTQTYYNDTLPIFYAMTEYIAAARDELNIVYAVHTGDVVDSPYYLWYMDAVDAMSKMGVPYSVLPGNHDETEDGKANVFLRFFPPLDSDSALHIERGASPDRMCRYDALRLGTTDFLFVYIAFPGNVSKWINWTNDVIAAHPLSVAVVCTHEYLSRASGYLHTGALIQDKVVARNDNVFMTLSGHVNNVDTIQSQFDDGWETRTVYNLVANYQYMLDKNHNKGGGFIRFIEIDEDAGLMRLYSYSPWHDEFMPIGANAVTQTDTLPIPWLEFVAK